jgi:hypothetical protein
MRAARPVAILGTIFACAILASAGDPPNRIRTIDFPEVSKRCVFFGACLALSTLRGRGSGKAAQLR